MSFHGVSRSNLYIDSIAVDMVSIFGMTMRDANRYLQLIDDVRKIANDDKSKDVTSALLSSGLAPIILAMKVADSRSFEKVTKELSIDPIKEVWSQCEEARKYFRNLASQKLSSSFYGGVKHEDFDNLVEELVQCLVNYIWDVDGRSQGTGDMWEEIFSFADSEKIAAIAEKIR